MHRPCGVENQCLAFRDAVRPPTVSRHSTNENISWHANQRKNVKVSGAGGRAESPSPAAAASQKSGYVIPITMRNGHTVQVTRVSQITDLLYPTRDVHKSSNYQRNPAIRELSLPRGRGVPYREFQDSAGSAWRVWDTYPTRPDTMAAKWRGGWLTFEGPAGRRRLAPIPKGWAEAPAARLELMCRGAEPALRATPPRGTAPPPAE
jgi:hypothetical protein